MLHVPRPLLCCVCTVVDKNNADLAVYRSALLKAAPVKVGDVLRSGCM